MARLLTCPDCAARYRVPPDAIGPDGQTVRCHACSTTWFVTGRPETPDALELADLERAELDRAGLERPSMVEAPAPVGAKAMVAGSESVPREEALEAPLRAPDAGALFRQKRAREARSRRLRGVRLIWLAALLVVLAGLAALWVFRQTLVDAQPQAANLYARVGETVRVGGLDLAQPEMRQARVDGTDYLIVTGEVVNISDSPQFVPVIALTLVGPGGEELAAWGVDIGGGRLAPGARRDWSTEYPNPPVDAARLRYQFEGRP